MQIKFSERKYRKELKKKRKEEILEIIMSRILESFCKEDTFLLGKQLGEQAQRGEVYALYGDLGVGKTVFTQGFAKGLNITEPVNSPTFTIVQIYESGRLPFYHFDVYRIADLEEMDEIGYEDYFYGAGVAMVEWADLIWELLPDNVKIITIEKVLEKGFDYRKITLKEEKKEKEERLL